MITTLPLKSFFFGGLVETGSSVLHNCTVFLAGMTSSVPPRPPTPELILKVSFRMDLLKRRHVNIHDACVQSFLLPLPTSLLDYKNNSRDFNQDGGVEGRVLTPSCESTRITPGCWTIIDRKILDFTKDDTPHPRTEEKPQ